MKDFSIFKAQSLQKENTFIYLAQPWPYFIATQTSFAEKKNVEI